MRIFDKELFIKDMGEPIGVEERWVNKCDGKEVKESEVEDVYYVIDTYNVVAKEWTKEVNG